MLSQAELYNQEVLEGHREALAALRELLAQENDPAERRKLANAILRARPVKNTKTDHAEAVSSGPSDTTAIPARPSTRDRNPELDGIPREPTRSTTTDLAHNRELHELHALMLSCAAGSVPEGSLNDTGPSVLATADALPLAALREPSSRSS